jgi:hypothetical protein
VWTTQNSVSVRSTRAVPRGEPLEIEFQLAALDGFLDCPRRGEQVAASEQRGDARDQMRQVTSLVR